MSKSRKLQASIGILFMVTMLLLSGCATIISGTRDEISVSSEPSGANVCLTAPIISGFGFSGFNFKDEVRVNGNPVGPKSVRTAGGLMVQNVCAETPAVFNVSKKEKGSSFQFEKKGYKPGTVILGTKIAPLFWANFFLLPGAGVGMMVDYLTGAFWEIPNKNIDVALEKEQAKEK